MNDSLRNHSRNPELLSIMIGLPTFPLVLQFAMGSREYQLNPERRMRSIGPLRNPDNDPTVYTTMEIKLRTAIAADAERVAEIHLASRNHSCRMLLWHTPIAMCGVGSPTT